MHTVMDAFAGGTRETVEAVALVAADPPPAPIITTLYDLMAALQATVEPDDDALVVATIVHMLRTGRLTWRGAVASLGSIPHSHDALIGFWGLR